MFNIELLPSFSYAETKSLTTAFEGSPGLGEGSVGSEPLSGNEMEEKQKESSKAIPYSSLKWVPCEYL